MIPCEKTSRQGGAGAPALPRPTMTCARKAVNPSHPPHTQIGARPFSPPLSPRSPIHPLPLSIPFHPPPPSCPALPTTLCFHPAPAASPAQVPFPLSPQRAEGFAMKWLVAAARKRKSRAGMGQGLSQELMQAHMGQGAAVQKRESVHKQAVANQVCVAGSKLRPTALPRPLHARCFPPRGDALCSLLPRLIPRPGCGTLPMEWRIFASSWRY